MTSLSPGGAIAGMAGLDGGHAEESGSPVEQEQVWKALEGSLERRCIGIFIVLTGSS